MRKLSVASVEMLARDREAIFRALTFPVISAVVFGLFDLEQAPELRIDLVGQRTVPMYRALREELGRVGAFELRSAEGLEAARRRLADGETDVVVVVASALPAPGSAAEVPVLYDGANADVNTSALSAVRRIVGTTNLRPAGVERPPLEVRTRPVEGRTIDYDDFPLPGLVAMGVSNLVFLNLGFAVAGRAANPDAAAGVGNVVSLPMMFLSGIFSPTDTLPAVMQRVVEHLPLTPLLEAMRKVALDGLSITATGPQLLRLAAWVVVSFALASRLFRFAEAR